MFMFRLYHYALGDLWDRAVRVKGFPTVSADTWKYICEVAMGLEKEHPSVVPAGELWVAKGFCIDLIPDWEIGFEGVKSVLVEEVA